MRVVDHLRHINQQINEACNRSGRSSDEVTVIAVTKYVSPERAQEAVDAGITCLERTGTPSCFANRKS